MGYQERSFFFTATAATTTLTFTSLTSGCCWGPVLDNVRVSSVPDSPPLVWQDSESGQAAVWLLDGMTLVRGALVGSPMGAHWQIKEVGDVGGPPGGPQQPSITLGPLVDAAPLPLTPLPIPTTGLNRSLPVHVQFFNSAGFSVTVDPIRIADDGTVIAAVPLYIDPTSHTITQGSVSVVVTQGNSASPPMALTIQVSHP